MPTFLGILRLDFQKKIKFENGCVFSTLRIIRTSKTVFIRLMFTIFRDQ